MPNIFGNFNHRKPWNSDFSRKATEADVVSCFRLLLGRKPGEQEWGGHVWKIGEELGSVVSSYLNSQEFAKRRLLDTGVSQWQLVSMPTFKMYASLEDKSIGQTIIYKREYERPVTRMFKKYLRPGMGVLDLGANIGYFSLLAASLVGPTGFVQSWEPAPGNVRALCASRAVNGLDHIEVVQAAAAEKNGLLQYFRNSINGSVGGVEHTDPDDLFTAETVMGLRVDDFISPDAKVGFIKIDVEGYEFRALQGARKTIERCRPIVVSEFGPPSLQDCSGVSGREYLEFFVGLGYDVLSMTRLRMKPGSVDEIISRFEESGRDHIDVVLLPRT
ncbi:MAG TPA: FkbM family methyltransferase [Terriglobales bacterium]|jgi:FkbM family methyltransferase